MLDLFPDSARIDAGELSLGGVRADELADRFGTPLVVYCEETIRQQAQALRAAAGAQGRVFYGTKAFPNVAVLRLLRDEGVGADVASAGELAFARRAGLSGAEIVVHGNNKDDALLRDAAEDGAPVVLDAPDEAARAAAAGVGASSSASRWVSTPTRTRRSSRGITARSSGCHRRRHGSPSSDALATRARRRSASTSTSARSFPTSPRRRRRSGASPRSRRPAATTSAGRRASPTSAAASGSATTPTTTCRKRPSSRVPPPSPPSNRSSPRGLPHRRSGSSRDGASSAGLE